MGNKVKTKLNININKDDSELNDFLYCWGQFKSRPNKVIIYNSYLKDPFSNIISEYIKEKNVFTEVIPADDFVIINDKMLVKVNDNLYISYLVLDRTNENSVIHDIIFFFKNYDTELELINEIIEKLDECIFDLEENTKTSKLNSLSITQNGLEMESIDFTNLDEEVDLYYSRDNLKGVDKLIKTIKKTNKGLSLFYGDRGTGKTSIINYISDKLDKIAIFIPSNMMESTINNPDFKTFLKKHPNPLLILDDCEVIFNQIFNRSNLFVNNLLQLVDGPISDSINLNIMMIFNSDDISDIDESLLECNNLIEVINFTHLSKDESNDLAKHIGSRKKYQNKTKLIDIIKKRNTAVIKKVGL